MAGSDFLPRIAITAGEPAGIGPDIIIGALQKDYSARITIIGDADVIRARSDQLDTKLVVETIQPDKISPIHRPGHASVMDLRCTGAVVPGKLDQKNVTQVLNSVNIATDACLAGKFDAMVTAPVHKAIINQAGINFSGHTEWIAERAGVSQPVMMLANDSLRVCLATTHLPLAQVPSAISQEMLEHVISVMHADLSSLYKIGAPVIGVCGLNPHAGEGGYLGTEEIEIIIPTIEKLKAQGMSLIGPLPADTAFTQHQLASFDAVLAMYHDQGLPVIKHQSFGEVVNVTLGLPIIRTSVDHGTALDLAASGEANPSSLDSALTLAINFAENSADHG